MEDISAPSNHIVRCSRRVAAYRRKQPVKVGGDVGKLRIENRHFPYMIAEDTSLVMFF